MRRRRSPAPAWTSLADTPAPTSASGDGEGTLASSLRRLPLFPRPNAVLFPHALLPLHIFEERYRVMAHELPDGRFNLVVRGRARIRIDRELPSGRPYRLVTATELPDFPITDATELVDADQTLRALIGQLADAIPEGGELLRQVVAAQDTPAELVDGVASALIVDPILRQRLLETRDVGERLERVAAEVVAMTARIGAPGTAN